MIDAVATPTAEAVVDVYGLLEAIYSPSLCVTDWWKLSPRAKEHTTPPGPLTRFARSRVWRRGDLRHRDERDLVQDALRWLLVRESLGEAARNSLGFDPAKARPDQTAQGAFLTYLFGVINAQWRITAKKWTRERRGGRYELVRVDELRGLDDERDPRHAFERLFTPPVDEILAGVNLQTREYLELTIVDEMQGAKAAQLVGLKPAAARKRAERAKKDRGKALMAAGWHSPDDRSSASRKWDRSSLPKVPKRKPSPPPPAWILDADGTPIAFLEWRPLWDVALRRRLPVQWPVMMATELTVEPMREAA